MKFSSIRSIVSLSKKHSGFTLTELIVVITILSILSVIGFVVMSHQSSVARDGKRISDIKTLSESARITSAQLRKLPTPIADSVSLSVSGSFIGYQGFMSLALVNPLGYGSDKIFDPKDNIPYTYRVNQHYDQAQFLAYLENPRFERTIEIAKQSLPSTLGDLANIGSFSNFGDTLSASLREATEGTMEGMRVSQAYAGDTMYPFDTAYALDSSSIDLSKRYPYSAGDRLGIFLSKGSNQPLQNGVTGTGSRDISLSDASTLDIIVGSQGADEYVSTDISTGSLNALKSGTFDEKALLGMNSGSGTGGGSGSGGGDSGGGGGGLPVSHILTMGEYNVMGNTYYGYIGPLTIGVYAGLGVNITTITPGSLVDDTVDGYVIDTFILDSNYQAPVAILAGSTDMPSNIAFETPYASIACTPQSSFLDVTPYGCTGSTISTDFYVGSQHDLGIVIPVAVITPSLPAPDNVIDAPINTDIISNVVTASDISTPVPLTVSGAEFRINGGSWVISANINNGDQVEYRTQVTQDGERKLVAISLDGINSQWVVDSYSCFSITDGNPNTTMVAGYNNTCTKDAVIPSVIFGKNVVGIYNRAFSGSQLTSVVIPNSVLDIYESAFYNNQLTSVTIPNGVTGIGASAFANNQLTSVVIGSGVTHIYDYAFLDNQLTSVTIPNGVTSIGYMAFRNNQLTSVTIPGSVGVIGDWAFERNQLMSLTIGNGVQGISQGAFTLNLLTSVTIPDSVVVIGSEAFRGNLLTSVTIPNSVTTIGQYAFQGNNLTSITIPNSVTTIGWFAFHVNNLTSITIPNSVSDIGGFAFADQYSSVGNGTIYGPASGYVKDRYINDNNHFVFDKTKLPNYVDTP